MRREKKTYAFHCSLAIMIMTGHPLNNLNIFNFVYCLA